MTMINVTPKRPSIIGIVIGAVLMGVGIWLLIREWAMLKTLLFIFAGFFLLLFGLGVLLTSAARRLVYVQK